MRSIYDSERKKRPITDWEEERECVGIKHSVTKERNVGEARLIKINQGGKSLRKTGETIASHQIGWKWHTCHYQVDFWVFLSASRFRY